MDDHPHLSGSVLVDLYVRLRDEVDNGDLSLDPNHKVRSSIVMAILGAAETITDVSVLEAHVRKVLGQAALPESLAA
jgi:hypothetical protein